MTNQNTATIQAGTLNPPVNKDNRRKWDDEEDSALAVISNNAFESTYGNLGYGKRDMWRAVVLRVDTFFDNQYSVKARIPELDGTIPEPVEWVPREVKSESHLTIELHRTYFGNGNTAPTIGQIIEVSVPPNRTRHPGRILALTQEYLKNARGLKSTAISSGAKAAADAPQDLADVPTTTGDGIGSGVKNPAAQIPSSQPSSPAPVPSPDKLSDEEIQAKVDAAIAQVQREREEQLRYACEVEGGENPQCGGIS
jgi:hypothetical protein